MTSVDIAWRARRRNEAWTTQYEHPSTSPPTPNNMSTRDGYTRKHRFEFEKHPVAESAEGGPLQGFKYVLVHGIGGISGSGFY